jgi:2'-5' RNA ligase
VLAAPAQVPAAWLRERTRYAVWVIDWDTDAHAAWHLRRRLAAVRAALSPWLTWGPRQPHLTLQVCGFLSQAAPAQWNDDFTPAMQAAQCAALAQLAPRRFTLRLGAVASFASAAYLTVQDDDGALPALRQALALGHGEFRNAPWVPHVTVGLYRRPWPWADVQAALSSLGSASEGSRGLVLPVRAVSLVSYDATDVGGRLRTLWRHALAR